MITNEFISIIKGNFDFHFKKYNSEVDNFKNTIRIMCDLKSIYKMEKEEITKSIKALSYITDFSDFKKMLKYNLDYIKKAVKYRKINNVKYYLITYKDTLHINIDFSNSINNEQYELLVTQINLMIHQACWFSLIGSHII